MPKMIKVDRFNYFCDKNMTHRISVYDESNTDICFVMTMKDKSRLIIPSDKIKLRYGGDISFEYAGETYLIDDGYRNTLIKAGYLIFGDYDNPKNHITDEELGISTRTKLKNLIITALREIEVKNADWTNLEFVNNRITCTFKTEMFEYQVVFDTVNSIVTKNQQRKINNLPFYPFEKDMDKYGTFYISVFCRKISEEKMDTDLLKLKYSWANSFISKLLDIMNSTTAPEFHFSSLPIKRKIIGWKGI